MSIPLCEQETIIRWAADEKTATISTANASIIRKLDRLAQEHPQDYTRLQELTGKHDARYTAPVKLVRFGKPASEARREASRKGYAARIDSTGENNRS